MIACVLPRANGDAGPLALAELIDLELQLAEDRERDPGELAQRDAKIARQIGRDGEPASRHEVLRRWLRSLPPGDGVSAGRRVQAHYRLAGWITAAATCVAGATAALGLLSYDGGHPVNIMGFLAVFVVLQLGLIALTVLGMLPRTWLVGMARGSGLHGLIRELGYRSAGLAKATRRAGATSLDVEAFFGRLAAWQTVYADVERWMLTALTQRAAVAFNVGAIIATVYAVSVHALAFAWSTTLEVDVDTMTRIVRAIAYPWRWLTVAVPTRELVEASRYFPGGNYDPDLLGDWWPFLLAALCAYGLIPRVLLAAYAARRALAARKSLLLDHGECATLSDRLSASAAGWGSGDPLGDPFGATADEERTVEAMPLPTGGASVRVIRWADAPVSRAEAERLVEKRFGWRLGLFEEARGSEDVGESALLAVLSGTGSDDPILVIAEAFEPPCKNLQRFVKALRACVGAKPAIVVGLLGADGVATVPGADDLRIWRRRMAALGDPRVRIEVLAA